MLVIRMQRTGRKGHAQFRVVVQDARRTPTSGKIVASLGHFNPHSKETSLDKEKAAFYLSHGAQPSERVVRLLKSEGVKLPAWVTLSEQKKREVRNADKRRSTRPASVEEPVDKPEEPKVEEQPAEPAVAEEASAEAPTAPAEAESTEEPVAVTEDVETTAEEPVVEKSAPEETVAAATEKTSEPSKTEEKDEA